MSKLNKIVFSLWLSLASSSVFAETVYTFAFSYADDFLYISSSVKSLDSIESYKGSNLLIKQWVDALKSSGKPPVTNTNLGKKLGSYFSSHDEADTYRRTMINNAGSKTVTVVSW